MKAREIGGLFTTGHVSSAGLLFLCAAVPKAPAPPAQLPRAESKTQGLITAYVPTYNRQIQLYNLKTHHKVRKRLRQTISNKFG